MKTALILTACLFALSAQAQQPAQRWYWCEPTKTYYPYVRSCAVPWKEVDSAPDAKRNEQLAAEAAKQQAAKADEEKKRQAAAIEANRKQQEDDQAKGYKRVTIEDFQLDKKTYPADATLIISGVYQKVGNIEHLVAQPWPVDQPEVFLITR